MTTIPETPAASLVNGTDLVWIWQNGQLLRATISQISTIYNVVQNSQLDNMLDGTIKSNISGAFTSPSDNTLTAILEYVLGSTTGSVLYRDASGWTVLTPGSDRQAIMSNGVSSAPSYRTINELPTVNPNYILANLGGVSGVPTGASLSDTIDAAVGSTRGSILYRGASAWTVLTPGTSGQALQSGGVGADPSWATLPGTGTVTSVDVGGGTTGLTFSGGPITTSGSLTAGGVLAIANGGTGATTTAGAMGAFGISYYVKQAVTASSTSLSIDYSLGGTVALALDSNVSVAFTISNWPASGTMGRLILEITSSGAYNITAWPGTTIWKGGVAPTITGSGKDTILLTSHDGGTNFRGYIVAQAMS